MKNISIQKYFTMLAITVIIALVAMVFFMRSNKTVTGIKQVYKAVQYENRLP